MHICSCIEEIRAEDEPLFSLHAVKLAAYNSTRRRSSAGNTSDTILQLVEIINTQNPPAPPPSSTEKHAIIPGNLRPWGPKVAHSEEAFHRVHLVLTLEGRFSCDKVECYTTHAPKIRLQIDTNESQRHKKETRAIRTFPNTKGELW